MKKTGKALEMTVANIQRALTKTAVVETNVKLPDKDTKKKRQVDIVVRNNQGDSTTIAIVEVRDHARPVDVEYVDEVVAKRTALSADVATIVSRSGFTDGAKLKAESLGIRLRTLAEVPETDWATWFMMKTVKVLNPRYQILFITLRTFDGQEIKTGADQMSTLAPVFDETGSAHPQNIGQVITTIINEMIPKIELEKHPESSHLQQNSKQALILQRCLCPIFMIMSGNWFASPKSKVWQKFGESRRICLFGNWIVARRGRDGNLDNRTTERKEHRVDLHCYWP